MGINRKSADKKAPQILKILRLAKRALMTHTLLIPAMIRNFLMFFLSGLIMRLSPFRRHGLHLGKNVRIQRLRSLITIGNQSHISIGDNTILFENAKLEAAGSGCIQIGNNGVIGDCRISSRESVLIGNGVLTSWNVFIQDHDPHPLDPLIRSAQVKNICRHFYPQFGSSLGAEDNDDLERILSRWSPISDAIVIGNDVWLGANCIILKGTRLGDGCVVAGGSVVTGGDFPAMSVVAGNPARVVKKIISEEFTT